MELLREIAFWERTRERRLEELKVGDLTTIGRIIEMEEVKGGRYTIITLNHGRKIISRPGDALEVII